MAITNVLFDTRIGDTKTIDGIAIGQTTPAAGTFTTLTYASPDIAYNAVASVPTANNLNLTGAFMVGGGVIVVTNLTAVLAANATLTLPTVSALVAAAVPSATSGVLGSSYEIDIYNSSTGAFTWTVTTNNGWTLNGTMTIAQNTFRRFIVTFLTATTATLQSLGEITLTSGI